MKFKLQIVILLFFTFNIISAQQYAITTNGDRVVLNDDKTWYYVDNVETKSDNQINNFTSSNLKSPVKKKAVSTTKKSPVKKQSTAKRKSSSSRSYITGPRGGCYYINSSGNKVYVDRSLCR